MKKKVFAFVGSRSVKRTTYGFVNEIISEISKRRDVDYEELTLNDLKIKHCIGCSSCFKKGHCIQKDDLNLLSKKILESDLFIIAAPVYMLGMPGEMKNIIDRLTSWAHTFRLVGKNVLIASTCDTNGHTTVVDQLHVYMLYMGARIVGKYVGTNLIPDNMKTDSHIMLLKDMNKDIPLCVDEILKKCDSKMVSNKFNESIFEKYKENQMFLINNNLSTGETKYWVNSGMIECRSYQDYIDLVLSRKSEKND